MPRLPGSCISDSHDEIASKIGLRPFAEFCDPIQSFAAAYGCDARQSNPKTWRYEQM